MPSFIERMRSAHAFDRALYALCKHEGHALRFGDVGQSVSVNGDHIRRISGAQGFRDVGDVDFDHPPSARSRLLEPGRASRIRSKPHLPWRGGDLQRLAVADRARSDDIVEDQHDLAHRSIRLKRQFFGRYFESRNADVRRPGG